MSKSLTICGSPIYKGKLMWLWQKKLFYFVRSKSVLNGVELVGHFVVFG
jgi:hypothetical protein